MASSGSAKEGAAHLARAIQLSVASASSSSSSSSQPRRSKLEEEEDDSIGGRSAGGGGVTASADDATALVTPGVPPAAAAGTVDDARLVHIHSDSESHASYPFVVATPEAARLFLKAIEAAGGAAFEAWDGACEAEQLLAGKPGLRGLDRSRAYVRVRRRVLLRERAQLWAAVGCRPGGEMGLVARGAAAVLALQCNTPRSEDGPGSAPEHHWQMQPHPLFPGSSPLNPLLVVAGCGSVSCLTHLRPANASHVGAEGSARPDAAVGDQGTHPYDEDEDGGTAGWPSHLIGSPGDVRPSDGRNAVHLAACRPDALEALTALSGRGDLDMVSSSVGTGDAQGTDEIGSGDMLPVRDWKRKRRERGPLELTALQCNALSHASEDGCRATPMLEVLRCSLAIAAQAASPSLLVAPSAGPSSSSGAEAGERWSSSGAEAGERWSQQAPFLETLRRGLRGAWALAKLSPDPALTDKGPGIYGSGSGVSVPVAALALECAGAWCLDDSGWVRRDTGGLLLPLCEASVKSGGWDPAGPLVMQNMALGLRGGGHRGPALSGSIGGGSHGSAMQHRSPTASFSSAASGFEGGDPFTRDPRDAAGDDGKDCDDEVGGGAATSRGSKP